mgnify:CR=1 FL=1
MSMLSSPEEVAEILTTFLASLNEYRSLLEAVLAADSQQSSSLPSSGFISLSLHVIQAIIPYVISFGHSPHPCDPAKAAQIKRLWKLLNTFLLVKTHLNQSTSATIHLPNSLVVTCSLCYSPCCHSWRRLSSARERAIRVLISQRC